MVKYYIDDWEKLSLDQKEDILTRLKEAGSLKETDEILSKTEQINTESWNPRKELCKAGCQTAFIAAAAACASLSGLEFGVCMSAAAEAKERCKDGC